MIAAVEHRHKVVWGVGPDQQAAYRDALAELKDKTPRALTFTRRWPCSARGLKWDKLEYCVIPADADLSGDGEWLYEAYITDTENQSDQIGLF